MADLDPHHDANELMKLEQAGVRIECIHQSSSLGRSCAQRCV
jgi:hypothetical protein